MRRISKENKRKNKQGQVLIINILVLVMTIVVFAAMLPILSETLNNSKDQTSLNCPSLASLPTGSCSTPGSGMPCYNSSVPKQTVACAMIDLYVPYIVIVVLIAGVAKLMANRVEGFFAPTQSPYPAY
ncbi:hypothetical protein M0R04_08915 [Candidatus Dojkabacteria bacterium]|jgi:hypothetical protein|nr:hypothetical protein [Candidatus Dojkabacteria bacterium]